MLHVARGSPFIVPRGLLAHRALWTPPKRSRLAAPAIIQAMAPTFYLAGNERFRGVLLAAGVAYVGPGDIISFTWWGGFRAYSAAKAGTKCVRVRAADTTQTDINSLADGSLDATTLAAFIVAHGACTVVTVYDQVGTNDLTQATAANQPNVTANAIGTSYGMTFVAGSSTILSSGSTVTQAPPYSLIAVAKQVNNVSDQGIFTVDDGSFGGADLSYTSANNFRMYATGPLIDQAEATNTMHAVQGIFIAGTGTNVNNVDGAESTGNGTPATITAMKINLGAIGAGSQFSSHVIMEAGYVAAAISGANRTSLNSNMHAAYGAW